MTLNASHLSLPKLGETANGDRAVARIVSEREALLSVIDGLGHGPEAQTAAVAAGEWLEEAPFDMALHAIMERLHEKLAGSRGAGATVCLLRGDTVSVCAVGNVELRCSELKIPMVFSPGVLGSRVAKFRICEARRTGKGRLVLFSDGVSSRLPLEDYRGMQPKDACEAILLRHRRKEDDATVLVADF